MNDIYCVKKSFVPGGIPEEALEGPRKLCACCRANGEVIGFDKIFQKPVVVVPSPELAAAVVNSVGACAQGGRVGVETLGPTTAPHHRTSN